MRNHWKKKAAALMLAASVMCAGGALTAYAEWDVPEETCTVDYKTQSAGVTVTYDGESDSDYILINVVIGEDAEGTQVIHLNEAITNCINQYVVKIVPGMSFPFKVTITNLSSHEYAYQKDSFVLSTANAHDYEQTEYLGYDGQLIPKNFVSAISFTPRAIYQDLFGVRGSANVTAEMAFNLYGYLEEAGYTGEDAFTQYVKDNNIDPDVLANTGNNSIRKMTVEELEEQMELHPEMAPYVVYQENGDGTLDVQFKWPEPELGAMSYNVFYQDYWSFAFGEAEWEQLNPNSNTAFTRTRGIGDYMEGTALYDTTDAFFTALTTDTLLNGESTEFVMGMAFDGPGIGNGYMNYEMAFYSAFELEQLDEEESTPPELPSFPERDPEVSEPDEEISEEETPLASAPVQDTEEASLVDAPEAIEDEDVPQVSAPQTGKAVGGAIGALALAAVAVIGLGKKRRK